MSAALQKNQDTLKNIRKSVSAFSSGLRAATKSSLGIAKSLRVGNREKRKSISLRFISFRKRRQAVQRREQEDLIEASNLKNLEKVPSPTKSIGRIIKQQQKNFPSNCDWVILDKNFEGQDFSPVSILNMIIKDKITPFYLEYLKKVNKINQLNLII